MVISACVRKRLGSDALTFLQHAQEEVLGADGAVVQIPGLYLRQNKDPASTVSEMLNIPTRVPESTVRITPIRISRAEQCRYGW